MRILVVTGIFPPDIGGPATYVPGIAKALQERGHKLTVITTSEPGRFDLEDSRHRHFIKRFYGEYPQSEASGHREIPTRLVNSEILG